MVLGSHFQASCPVSQDMMEAYVEPSPCALLPRKFTSQQIYLKTLCCGFRITLHAVLFSESLNERRSTGKTLFLSAVFSESGSRSSILAEYRTNQDPDPGF
jgi:hypothetical protein